MKTLLSLYCEKMKRNSKRQGRRNGQNKVTEQCILSSIFFFCFGMDNAEKFSKTN